MAGERTRPLTGSPLNWGSRDEVVNQKHGRGVDLYHPAVPALWHDEPHWALKELLPMALTPPHTHTNVLKC